MYDRLLLEMKNTSRISWKRFNELDEQYLTMFAMQALLSVAIIISVIALQFFTTIMSVQVKALIEIVVLFTLSLSLLYYLSKRTKHLHRLLEWDDAIENRCYSDVIYGVVKPMVKTSGLMSEIVNLKMKMLEL